MHTKKRGISGSYQLQHIDRHSAAALIPNVLPKTWFNNPITEWDPAKTGPPAEWLETLWEFLRKQFPLDISTFYGMPLLPLTKEPPFKLVSLSQNSRCIIRSANRMNLETELEPFLEIFGVYIVDDLPEYVQGHALVVGDLIKLPVPEDILKVSFHSNTTQISTDVVEKIRTDTTIQQKAAFINMLVSLPLQTAANSGSTTILKHLPIFLSTHSTETKSDFVSAVEVSRGANLDDMPCLVKERFVDVSDPEAKRLAEILGINVLDQATVLEEYVLADIQAGQCDQQTTETVVLHVFKNFSKYMQTNPGILHSLAEVPFIRTRSGNFRTPSELCDPESDLLCSLFAEQDMFPAGNFAEEKHLIFLRQLGLKTEKSITAADLHSSMLSVEAIARQDSFDHLEDKAESSLSKSVALLKYLDGRPEVLTEFVQDQSLAELGKNIAWLPTLKEKPPFFPSGVAWYSAPAVCSPAKMWPLDWSPLVGLVHPVVAITVCKEMTTSLGWTQTPPLAVVVQQLAHVIQKYHPAEKAMYLTVITRIYDYFKRQEDPHTLQEDIQKAGIMDWVWQGDGFSSLDKFVMRRPMMDLQPYTFTLPSEMQQFEDLFASLGMRRECKLEDLINILHQVQQTHSAGSVGPDMVQSDLQLSIDILNYLKEAELPVELQAEILLPVQPSDSTSCLQLLPICDCTYCDSDWLKQGFNLMAFDEQDGINFIHPNLSVATAESLGVPTLMSRMLHAEELSITGFGQEEKLTCRLHQLLEGYTDGLSVFKEMIQNADDAGATEFRVLYDERSNTDAVKYLIDDGMKECQGPALWVYNNAVFTEQDFNNITNLGGATKEAETEKIGRFGLGFNVVYNITDVPSFVSQNNIVFFDPHKRHLGKGIQDRSKPGIRIDMNKNRTLLRKLCDQFRPYQNVFGCNMNPDKSSGYYNGTLFRLPLRTQHQAVDSDICDKHYGKFQVRDLLSILAKHAHSLLLFTQNVTKVEVFHVPKEGNPADANQIMCIERNIIQPIRMSSQLPCGDKEQWGALSAFLASTAQYMKQKKQKTLGKVVSMPEVPRITMVIKTVFHQATPERDSLELWSQGESFRNGDQYWMISHCVGHDESLKFAQETKENLVPAGAVAVALRSANGGYLPVLCKGQVFTYLPLPIYTGLPVHINGAFALESSRRHLTEKTAEDKEERGAVWNQLLQEDAVCCAYFQMMMDLEELKPTEEIGSFWEVWPTLISTTEYFRPLIYSFYKERSSVMRIPLYVRDGVYISLNDAIFLDPLLEGTKTVVDCAREVIVQCLSDKFLLTPTQAVLESLQSMGYENTLQEKHYSVHRFFKEIVFPNLNQLTCLQRDTLVVYALEQSDRDLNNLLQNTACIPASPTGETLCKPLQLINPKGMISKIFRLYLPEDGRFPHGEQYITDNILKHLIELGMKDSELDWGDLIERAHSIKTAFAVDWESGNNRLHSYFAFLDKALLRPGRYGRTGQSQSQDQNVEDPEIEQARSSLMQIPFLLVQPTDTAFPIAWAGDDYNKDDLLPPSALYSVEQKYLVGAVRPLAKETNMPPSVKDFLGLKAKRPAFEEVAKQMDLTLEVDPAALEAESRKNLRAMVSELYCYLQHCLKDSQAEEHCQILAHKPCIFIEDRFLKPSQVALNFLSDCPPYLYRLPFEMNRMFGILFQKLGVKKHFPPKTYMEMLQHVKSKQDERPLTVEELPKVINLVRGLAESIQATKEAAASIEGKYETIYVPDTRGVLQPSSSLCYNDCPWSNDLQCDLTHSEITFETCKCLGVKTKRLQLFTQNAKFLPFGQKESLAHTLKRILDTYPCDHEILQEIIQNADDAEATEIHFVCDPRQHSTHRVFGECWEPLQGPALCVYNNRPFTEADLKGIQQLGEGSKRMDPNKTGQYGIGFSSVYHLTDAPSILTSSDTLGKNLCVFDPHCLYIPKATSDKPGMRLNVENVQMMYADVFEAYLPEIFNIKNSTLFRFPLRTKEMAAKSEISKHSIDVDTMQQILEKLKQEVLDILVFTNNIQRISISSIDPETGKLINTYSAMATYSKEHREERDRMKEHLKKYSRQLQCGYITIGDIPWRGAGWTLLISDNADNEEHWNVSQTVGLKPKTCVPEDVKQAFISQDLALMPRGGIACRVHCNTVLPRTKTPSCGRVFCFLPLPIETHFPVHINGHFALGYENRRHLWTNMNKAAYKTEWNSLLCREVLPYSYCQLLESIRLLGLNSEMKANSSTVLCCREELDMALKKFFHFFPQYHSDSPQWDTLITSIYQLLAKDDIPVLPTVRLEQHLVQENTTQWLVQWMPPAGDGLKKAFFINFETHVPAQSCPFTVRSKSPPQHLEKLYILKEVLLASHLKLLEIPQSIESNFRQSNVKVKFLTPQEVMLFYLSYSTNNPMCEIGQLPVKLDKTPFRCKEHLSVVLQYCQEDPKFYDKLEGLPLLLTSDGVLRVFSQYAPVFYTDHQSLVPKKSNLFLEKMMKTTVFKNLIPTQWQMFKLLDIASLAELLPHALPEELLRGCTKPVPWKTHDASIPTEQWVRNLWHFIHEDLRAFDRTKVTNKTVMKKLKPIHNWCLLPAKAMKKFFLVPVNQSHTVVYLESREYSHYTVKEIFGRLGVLELDLGSINSRYNLDIVEPIVSTFEHPFELLRLLHVKVIQLKASRSDFKFSQKEASDLLNYFFEHLPTLQEDYTNVKLLRDLPVFTTICHEVISLTDCVAYTVPARVPTDGVDVWQNQSGIVFLERHEQYEDLYRFLGCASIGFLEVYIRFIFQHMEYFSPGDRMVHLHHIYMTYLKPKNSQELSAADKQNLLDALKELPFIDDGTGELKPASEFYDPENKLFTLFLPKDKFLPRVCHMFKHDSDWHNFLGQLGLVRIVSKKMYLRFTKQVARESQVSGGNATLITKSKVLVKHLFDMDVHSRNDILTDIVHIPFLCQEKSVSPHLTNIYPQHGDLGNGTLAAMTFHNSVARDQEKLVWTCCSLLPDWADPCRQYGLDVEMQKNIEQKLNIQRQAPMKKVVSHLETLSEHLSQSNNTGICRIVKDVFKAIYHFLQEQVLAGHDAEKEELKEKLKVMQCVLVDNCTTLVSPACTVLNLYDSDQIKPFLYKFPMEFGEFHRLFQQIGATDRPTPQQYGTTLEGFKRQIGENKMSPNEVAKVMLAMKGLLQVSESCRTQDMNLHYLYLPSQDGHLVESTTLICNDAPSFYERVRDIKMNFLVRTRDYSYRNRGPEIFSSFPQNLRPSMLSAHVRESLVDSVTCFNSHTGVALHLNDRIKSEAFLHAVGRLIHHEAHRTNHKVTQQEEIENVLKRLSLITVHGVDQVRTHLIYKDKPIRGSEVEKTCFVQKVTGASLDIVSWNVYIQNESRLDQDLLIPLAEVINTILSGCLHASVLYLLPILACEESQMQKKLDSLNVRLDHTNSNSAWSEADQGPSVFPTLGTAVDEQHRKMLRPGENDFQSGEYVGYQKDPESPVLHGCLREETVTEAATHVYMVDIGADQDSVAQTSQLLKYI